MVNHEQQDGDAEAGAPSPAAIPALTPQGASRRRIAGLGVSGVVMTVASNHAMAALVCKSPSGALSGNLNSQKPDLACNGAKPEYWANRNTPWPSEVRTNDRFHSIFQVNGPLGGDSCLDVVTGSDRDANRVAMHVMATYLNVCSGRITFLTRQAVKDIWLKFDTHGSYTPVGGAEPWTAAELVSYLSSTMS